jgi:hypothetical protein
MYVCSTAMMIRFSAHSDRSGGGGGSSPSHTGPTAAIHTCPTHAARSIPWVALPLCAVPPLRVRQVDHTFSVSRAHRRQVTNLLLVGMDFKSSVYRLETDSPTLCSSTTTQTITPLTHPYHQHLEFLPLGRVEEGHAEGVEVLRRVRDRGGGGGG